MTRFLHVSDTHLGTAVYGSDARRADFTDAFVQALDVAVEEGVDAVVHTGDLTDSNEWDETLPGRAVDALEALQDASIPFLFVLGNHDTTDSGRPQAWVSELESANLVTRLSRDAVDVGGVAVYGVDYHDADWWVDADVGFEPAVGDPPTVLALHQAVEPFAPHGGGELDLASFLDTTNVAFDAVLLGHKHATLERSVNGALSTYAGTTERFSRAERDNHPKVNLVPVSEDGVDREERSLDTRPFPEWTVVAGDGDDADSLGEALVDALPAESVLTIHVVAGDGASVDAAAVRDAVAPLDPIDVDVREVSREHTAEPGVYVGDPSALTDAPAVTTRGDTAKDDTATSDVTGTATDAATDTETPYEAYVAGLPDRGAVCDFVLDPDRWEDHFGVTVHRDEWTCPRVAEDGCCRFHEPLVQRDDSPGETVDAFCAAVEDGSETAFVGARFASLDLSHRYVDGPHNYPVDLSYARIDDGVNLSQCVVGNELRLVGTAADRIHAEAATFEAAVDARHATVAGTAEFGTTRFERGADFADADFQAGRFEGCVFAGDATFSDATFHGAATFDEVEFARAATFHETTFGDGARFEHASFKGKSNFRRAVFDGTARFFAVRADQFFGCYDATFDGDAVFYSAGFGPVTHFRLITVRGDADFRTATFGRQEVDFSGATVDGDADFTRARFAGRLSFTSAAHGPAEFRGPARFTRATFDDDADFAGVAFADIARFDRTTWQGKASFGSGPVGRADCSDAATFGDAAAFDRAKFHDDVHCEGVTWRGVLSASGVHVRGAFDATSATVDDGATLANSEIRTLRLDGVQAPGGDPVVALTNADVARGSITQRAPSPPLYDLTRASVSDVSVTGDDAVAPAFDTLFVNQTQFDGFEFTASHDHVPDSWLLHRVSDRYEGVVRPALSAREKETTYRNAKQGADAAGDFRASAELFQHEMAFRRETYTENVPVDAGHRERLVGRWQECRNRVLGATTGYGERTSRVIGTGVLVILVVFPALYAAVDAVSPESLDGAYGSLAGYVRLSLEAFVALVLGDPSAVAGPVARLLVYGEALVGTLVVAMLVLTLTRSVYR
jgi:uncharacterized protein YjbI with pentapeptide repeats